MKRVLVSLLLLSLSGCLSTPEWRVGQQEVPEPITVTPEQREAWRVGADYVAKTVEEPVEVVYVADALSSSLGAPEHPSSDADAIAGKLLKAYQSEQAEVRRLNKILDKYEGTKLEGTGINMFGPLGGLSGILLIALFIFVPGSFTAALWIGKRAASRTQGALKAVVKSVQSYESENPVEAKKLKDQFSKKMDETHKLLIRKLAQ